MTTSSGATEGTGAARAAPGVHKQGRVICFADLVESVRLMQRHEALAIDRWLRFAAWAREVLVPIHGGRTVRTAGDGLLMEFDTAPGALAAAFALHDEVCRYNDGFGADDAMWLRIGLNVADVVATDDDLYGSGVNLCARLAGLAQPGQTVASEMLCSALTHEVHADIEDLGPRYLKHVEEPVRAFVLRPPGSHGALGHAPAPLAADLRPALAVVPFSCLPADAQHDALGYAMADDIIAALSRHPGLRVLSRMSTAALRDTTLDLPRLQTLLGASYLLSGRFYVQGTRARASIELCDLRDGQVLWTGSAMAEVAALFEGQDDLVPHVVSNVSQCVMAHEVARVRSLPMTTLESFTLYIGATGLMASLVRPEFQRARDVIEHLADRHPRQAAPPAELARWRIFNVVQGWAGDTAAEIAQAGVLAAKALDIDPQQPKALAARAWVRLVKSNDIEGARQDYTAALQADPQDANTWALLSAVHSYANEHTQAQAATGHALRLSPLDPNLFLLQAYAAMADIGAGDYASAVTHAQASVRRHLLHSPSHILLVGALALAGRDGEAKAAAQRALQVCPTIKTGLRGGRSSTVHADWRDRLADAARSAGLP